MSTIAEFFLGIFLKYKFRAPSFRDFSSISILPRE
jgi:hypothetical protein